MVRNAHFNPTSGARFGPVLVQPPAFARPSSRTGIYRFRPQIPPPRFDPTTIGSESSGLAGKTYNFAKDMLVTTAIGKGISTVADKAPQAVQILPEAAQTTIQTVTNTTSSVLSSAQEMGKTVLEESAKVFSPIKTAFSWGAWGFGFLPTSVKIGLGLLTAYAAYRVFRGSRSGASSSSANVNLHINIQGMSDGVRIETTGDKQSSVRIRRGANKTQNVSNSAFMPPVAPLPASGLAPAGGEFRCRPIGTGPEGEVLLSCQTGAPPGVQHWPTCEAYRLRLWLKGSVNDPVLSEDLRKEIKLFLQDAENPEKAPYRVKNKEAHFQRANALYEKVFQQTREHIEDALIAPHVRLQKGFLRAVTASAAA